MSSPVPVIPPQLSGRDLLGWTALPLLADLPTGGGAWLFVTMPHQAWLSRGPLSDADFTPVPLNHQRPWPLESGGLAGVVIHSDALPKGGRHIESSLRESLRVTAGHFNVLVVCRPSSASRGLRSWRAYGRSTAAQWLRAGEAAGVRACQSAILRLDGDRVTELEPVTEGTVTAQRGDRVVLRVPAGGERDDTLRALVHEASRCSGIPLRTEGVRVRKIGKTAVLLSGSDGRRYVMRVARSPIALSRAARNFAAIETVHRSRLPEARRACVPAAIARGIHDGYAFFLETCVGGRKLVPGGERSGAADTWPMDAVSFITELHLATRRTESFGSDALRRLVQVPVAHLTRACSSSKGAAAVLRQVSVACERGLLGRAVPVVMTHGDYTAENCLFDTGDRLTGVVDWEVSEGNGLPLLDLLQLMPIPGERATAPRWQRFDAWMALLAEPARVTADPVLGPYLRALDVPPAAVPALVLLQWVTHAADRVAARRDDERWMRLRVWQPLTSLERVLSA